MPWTQLIATLKPYYFPDAYTGPGRRSIGLGRMLRMYCLEQWYFDMKPHIGEDVDSGLVNTLVGTAANVSEITQTEHLLHDQEQAVSAGAGYIGAEKREALKDKVVMWYITIKRGKLTLVVGQT